MYVIGVLFSFNRHDVHWVIDEGDVMDTIKFLESSDQAESYEISQIGTNYLDARNEFGLIMKDYPKLR
jgi:hypothetical protein